MLMTSYVHIYHLCLAALLAGCATIAQLNEAQPTAKQAAAYPDCLSASDLSAAVATDLQSQPATDLSWQAQLDQKATALRGQNLTGE